MTQDRPFIRYIPFTSDYGFKVTFGNEHNTLFLRRALQALIDPDQSIEEVYFEKNVKEGDTEESRGGIYDLTCRHANGDISIVEMQMPGYPRFVKRLEYYALLRMAPFVKKGQWHFEGIPRIFAIGILGFNLFPGPDFYTRGFIRDDIGNVLDDSLVFIFVELEKFDKPAELCTTNLDKLIFIMKEAHNLAEKGEKPEFMKEDWVAAAIEELDSRRMSPEERANLEIAIAREMSNRVAAKQWQEHIAVLATKEGMEKGMEKGMKKGMKKGEQERLKKDILRLIKKTDWTDEQIAEVLEIATDLVEEIRKGQL